MLHAPISTHRSPNATAAAVCLLALACALISTRPARAEQPPVSANHSAASTLPGFVVVPLGRGHLNRICLAASVEGVKGLMIVDTGANHSGLSDGKYRFLLPGADHKLPPGLPATVKVNGRTSSVVAARDFQVHGTNLGALPLVLLKHGDLYESIMDQRQYDGLLGEDLLRRFRAVVDCGRLVVYLNTDPSRKLNLGPALTQAGWTRVPMSDLANDFVVPCEVNGRHFRMVVDTGAPFTTMDRSMLLGVNVTGRDTHLRAGIIGTRAEAMGYVELPVSRIGSYNVTGMPVFVDPHSAGFFQDAANDKLSGKVLGLLGGNFLGSNNAIIDIGGKALYLKPGKPKR